MIKKLLILSFLLILNNCSAPGTALLGPAFTGVKTGSVYQASLSYGTGKIINEVNPTQYLLKNYNSNNQNIFSSKVKNLYIPYIESDPIILAFYKIDKVEFSEIIEPEPLP